MDSPELRRLVPHYVAVMVLVFVVAAVDVLAEIPFWAGVVIALGIGAVYRPLVVALGVAPEPLAGEMIHPSDPADPSSSIRTQ